MSNTPIIDSINAMSRADAGRKLNHKTRRPIMGRDDEKYRNNYDRIFKKKKTK